MDWREMVFPEIREFEPPQRQQALREARSNDFDSLEWAGIIAAVVLASALVGKPDLQAAAGGGRFLSTPLAFLIALPVVAVTAGAFMIGRTRRGLKKSLARRRGIGRG